MKRTILFITIFLIIGCVNKEINLSALKAGQIFSEKSENLEAGFKLVHREVVSPPGHWEGLQHFSFLYYQDRQLCQCSAAGFSISPSGRYAILQNGPTGKIFLFNVQTGILTEVSQKYIGTPEEFTWDEANSLVTVTFFQGLNNGYKDAAPISVQLQ